MGIFNCYLLCIRGLLETTLGSFIISAERNSAAKFSILEVWFGVGTLGFPLLVNYIIKFYEWYFILYGILLFFIFTLFVWYMFGRTKFLNFSPQNNGKGGASLSSFTLKFKRLQLYYSFHFLHFYMQA